MTPEFLDPNTAQEVEFILWGLVITGVFCIVTGFVIFAKYCWRTLTK